MIEVKMETRKEKLLIKLFDRKINIMHDLEKMLGDDISLVYELLEVNQQLDDLQLEEEIEVLD
jgi:hypothetical protein